MANKASNFSDLIQRVTASCLLQRSSFTPSEEEEGEEEEVEEEEEEERRSVKLYKTASLGRVEEIETLLTEVFDAVSAMKKAYVLVQDAHSPWDPEGMRAADVAVVGEFRKLGVLRERFRRGNRRSGSEENGRRDRGGGGGMGLLREVVAPYEAAVEELKKVVKAKEAEVEKLKERIIRESENGKRVGRASRRKVGCSSSTTSLLAASAATAQVAASPAPELFEATMSLVKETSKSFTSILLSLMRTAHWDIAAAVRSIEAATASTDNTTVQGVTAVSIPSTIATQHAKYALESYISRKIFQGFDHETFYLDGSLSSLINPDQFRRDCFTQYRDMKAMEPTELLGILPTCHFGKFCSRKYLAIVHPRMEESLFGNLEQRQTVLAGNHPRSQFYGEFLGLAKAIWSLHLLAFSLDPAPSQFEASRGAEFHPQYMESVVKFAGGRIPAGQIVGFPVTPGFKIGNGSVIKARVYLVPRT